MGASWAVLMRRITSCKKGTISKAETDQTVAIFGRELGRFDAFCLENKMARMKFWRQSGGMRGHRGTSKEGLRNTKNVWDVCGIALGSDKRCERGEMREKELQERRDACEEEA